MLAVVVLSDFQSCSANRQHRPLKSLSLRICTALVTYCLVLQRNKRHKRLAGPVHTGGLPTILYQRYMYLHTHVVCSMVNPPSSLLSIHAHAQSREAVCLSGTTWSVLYVLCNPTSVCFYTEWSICPEDEDVTCRGSLVVAHVYFGALPAVCSDRSFFSAAMDFYVRQWPQFRTIPFLNRLCRSKLENVDGPPGPWSSFLLVAPLPSASLSPHRLLRCSRAC
ncbi:hypothetical protein ACQKWADRAFT_289053 [Trichoderma austrokoningii]